MEAISCSPLRVLLRNCYYTIAHGCTSRRNNPTAWSCRWRVQRGTRSKEETTVDKKARRKTRCDKGQIQLTDRDLWVLHWIAEQYAARLDQVQNLLGQEAGRGAKEEGAISESAARLVVDRWKRARLADARKMTVEDPAWIWLTAHGLHEFDLSYKLYEPSLAKLEHLFAVNEVRLAVENQRHDAGWRSERALRAGLAYTSGQALPHIPDAELLTEEGATAIEVELTPKKPRDLQLILQELAENYHQVWYFVADEASHAVASAQQKLAPHLAARIVMYSYPGWDEDEDDLEEGGEDEA
jgi:hypothetical protein